MAKGRAYKRRRPLAEAGVTNYLRQWRERPTEAFPEGMSQEDLAEASGLSVASISAYETGGTNPSMVALHKLSEALGIPRGMLLDANPDEEASLWEAYLRASKDQRGAISKMAAGLVGPPKSGRPR